MNRIPITITSNDKVIKAKGLYAIDTGKVIILKGSNIRDIRIDNYRYFNLRNKLIGSGKIVNSIFQEDVEFDNPNIAAGIVLGRNASGKERIKLENGKPLKIILGDMICIKAESRPKIKQIKNKLINIVKIGGTRKYDEKRFCEESYKYLISIKPECVTDDDLEFSRKGGFNGYNSLNDVLERMLISTQNYQSKPNVIKYRLDLNRKEKIDKILFGLDAQKILEEYTCDSLCEIFQKELGVNVGQTWKSRCKSIISSSKFISGFKSVDDFKNFIESYDSDSDSRIRLIKYIQHNVHGFGFALSCDFIKELGYTSFSKPDVHIKDILLGLGLCKTTDDEIVFRCLNNIAEKGGYTPYKLDKILWMISSGKFYSSKINVRAEIPRHKDAFIQYMLNL